MRRLVPVLVVVLSLLAACSGDDRDAADGPGDRDAADSGDEPGAPDARFCDAYLGYLSDSTDENLETVVASSDDPQVAEYAEVITSAVAIDRLLAATLDLDDLARERCQPEWTAGAQGAGNTAAAAQAFFDALIAGDELGARNVASANAIAVFEPWEPIEPDPSIGSPALADVGGQSFSVVLGPAVVAQCEVETGVVVACQFAE